MKLKKLLSLFLVLVMVLSMVACSGGTNLEQDLQDLEDILGVFEEIGEGLYEDTVGQEETADSEDLPIISIEDGTETVVESNDEIVEFTSQGADPETTEPTHESEVFPDVTQENELPMDFFEPVESTTPAVEVPVLDENGSYTTMEDVALYIYTYHKLPKNFITKKQAQALGWPGGNLEPYAPGKCIGGDRFGNYEELLPTNHNYTECDIDTLGAKSRGAKRIVFSNDYSLIYYTDDHYESFTLLYGEE